MALPSGSLQHFNGKSSCNEKDNQAAIHSLADFMEVSSVEHEHMYLCYNLPYMPRVPHRCYHHFFSKMPPEPLILTFDWVIDPSIDWLINYCTCQTQTVLTELVLGDCNVGNKEIKILFKATEMLTGLHHLDLSCNCIGNDGVLILSRFVVGYHSFIY